jgi:hypothetical protein
MFIPGLIMFVIAWIAFQLTVNYYWPLIGIALRTAGT